MPRIRLKIAVLIAGRGELITPLPGVVQVCGPDSEMSRSARKMLA